MKTGLMTAALAATIATTMWATPTQACSLDYDDTWGEFTFRDQSLPTNAELWVTNVDDIVGPETTFALVDPAGTTSAARIEREGPDGRVVADVALSPGSWSLQLIAATEEDGVDTVYDELRFEIDDDDDTTPPPAPVVLVESVTEGGNPLAWVTEPCAPRERRTIRIISIDVQSPDDVARVMIDGVAFNTSGGYVGVANREEDGSDVVVSVVDFAGNESDVVVTSPVARGGCASVPAAPMSLLALGLLFRRRRATANSARTRRT